MCLDKSVRNSAISTYVTRPSKHLSRWEPKPHVLQSIFFFSLLSYLLTEFLIVRVFNFQFITLLKKEICTFKGTRAATTTGTTVFGTATTGTIISGTTNSGTIIFGTTPTGTTISGIATAGTKTIEFFYNKFFF